jgi:hypothetical protein
MGCFARDNHELTTTQWDGTAMQDNRAANDNQLHTLISSLSSTLNNIDLEYQSELQRLQASHLTGEFRRVISQTLQERHRQRREPYVKHLAELRRQAKTIAHT